MNQHPERLNELPHGTNLEDYNGNLYTLEVTPIGTRVNFHQVNSFARGKNIGTVSPRTNIYCKHEYEQQIYRKLDAWTIPKILLVRANGVRYITPTTVYEIDAERALEFGTALDSGGEDKIAVPLSYWTVISRA